MTISMEDLKNTLYDTESAVYAAEELGTVINHYVRSLPERQRYIFIDRFYLAEPVETIASDLSLSVQTVYREIEKIKQGLKLYLERNEVYI